MTPPFTLSSSRQRLILCVLIFSQLLVWLDNTILSTAFETLASPVRGLGASPGQLQWMVGSYTLVLATLMFTAGAAGDRFGHRTVLMSGMVLFGASSLWAAYSGSADELIAARAAMGVGGALVMPPTMAVLTWTFTGPARAGAFGVFSSFAGVGLAGGPVLAGVLLGHFWWGSVFLVNVPVAVCGLVGVAVLVPNFRSPTRRPLDPAGLVLSVAGLGLLAFGLIRAGQVATFGAVGVWAPVAGGLVLLGVFTAAELRLRHPSFDVKLLGQRIFGGGNAALGLLFLAMTASSYFVAFYLQGARGYSPLAAGVAATPAALGVVIGAPLSTRLVRRWSVRPVTATALAAAGVPMGLFTFFGANTPIAWNELLAFAQGLSIGMVIAPVTTAVLSTLSLERAGAGAAVNNTMRQAGSVIGIALGGTITAIVYHGGIAGALTGASPSVRQQAEVSAEQARHVAALIHEPRLATAANDAFLHAMHVTALWSMAVALAGALTLLFALRPDRPPARTPHTAADEVPASEITASEVTDPATR